MVQNKESEQRKTSKIILIDLVVHCTSIFLYLIFPLLSCLFCFVWVSSWVRGCVAVLGVCSLVFVVVVVFCFNVIWFGCVQVESFLIIVFFRFCCCCSCCCVVFVVVAVLHYQTTMI